MTTATETAAPASSDEFLTVGEVAKLLRTTPMTIYTEIHDGRLDAIRIGRRTYRISKESYDAYKEAQRTTPRETGQLVPADAA